MWWQDTQTRQQQAISKIKEMIYSCSIGWISMNIFIKLQIKKLLKISEEYFGEKYWSSCSEDSAFLPTPATDPTKYPSCVTSVPAVFFITVNLKKSLGMRNQSFVMKLYPMLDDSGCRVFVIFLHLLLQQKLFIAIASFVYTYTYKNPGLQHNRWGNVPLHLYSC